MVAVDVGGTTMKGALVDASGAASCAERRPTDGVEGVLEFVEVLAGLGGAAVGVAVPGLVRDADGVVLEATNLGWRDVPIRELISGRVGVPVAVLHDVRAAGLAEGLMGAARGCRDYVLLTVGTGIGAAVVIGGAPYTGSHGMGGELGHVVVDPHGPECGCGGRGCLEALASAGHVAARYGGDGAASASAEEVAARAVAGEELAASVWAEAVDALALAIVNYATLLDPEVAVVGGGMAEAGDDLFVPLRGKVAAYTRFGDPCPVVPAALGEEAGRHGAAIAAWRAAGASVFESWAEV